MASSSITSSPVNECGAGKNSNKLLSSGWPSASGKSVNTATRGGRLAATERARHRQQILAGQTNHANPAATGRGGNGGNGGQTNSGHDKFLKTGEVAG